MISNSPKYAIKQLPLINNLCCKVAINSAEEKAHLNEPYNLPRYAKI
jgi:hypothetical protein